MKKTIKKLIAIDLCFLLHLKISFDPHQNSFQKNLYYFPFSIRNGTADSGQNY